MDIQGRKRGLRGRMEVEKTKPGSLGSRAGPRTHRSDKPTHTTCRLWWIKIREGTYLLKDANRLYSLLLSRTAISVQGSSSVLEGWQSVSGCYQRGGAVCKK